MSLDSNGNSVWSSGDPISNLIAPPPPTTPAPQPAPNPSSQVIPAPTPRDDQSRLSEQNRQFLHDNQHFDAGNGTYLHISMAPPDLLAAANAQAEKLYPSNPYFGNSQFGQNHPKAAQVISNMLLGLSAYNPGNEPQSAGQSAAQVARMALAPQAYSQRTNLERNDFVTSQVNAARVQQSAQTETELKLAQIAKANEGTPVGEPREDGQGGTFQIMNTPRGLISVPYPVQRPNSPNVIAPNPANLSSSQGTPVAGTIAAPPTSGSPTSNAPYGTPLGQKPSEEDKALMDYMQTSGLPNTPQGREQARTDLFYRQHPSDAPIGSDGAKSKNAIITSQLKKAGIDASLYSVSATDSVTSANAKQSAAEKALSDQRAQQAAERIANAAANKDSDKNSQVGWAFNPQTKEKIFTTAGEAKTNGYQYFQKDTSTDTEKAETTQRQWNDVQLNISRYRMAVNALPGNISTDHAKNMEAILSDGSVLPSVSVLGTGFSSGRLGDVLKNTTHSTEWNYLTPQERDAVTGYLRSKSTILAYQKALSGSSRSNKEMLDLEMNNIPDPTVGATVAGPRFDAFQENIDTASQGIGRVPWMESVRELRARIENPSSNKQPPTQGGFAAWKKSQSGNQ